MRQLVIDTETTGLNASTGDRVIEIGCVELYQRRLTGNNLHFYLNPERDSDPAALAVHGLTTKFLSDKPKFAEIAEQFCDFCAGAEVIIHNASFDVGFLNAELKRLERPAFTTYCSTVIDTLAQSRLLFPGKRHSLDALCDRLGVRRGHRTLHGALLDAELLAQVYLALTRGQTQLAMADVEDAVLPAAIEAANALPPISLPVHLATPEEEAAHIKILEELSAATAKECVWEKNPL